MCRVFFFVVISFISLVSAAEEFNDPDRVKKPTIPVLDFKEYLNKETSGKFIEQIREALHDTGFFALKNTGVDQKILKDVYSSMAKFFSFDKEEKIKVSSVPYENQRGYTTFGEESAKGSSKGDYKEYYAIGRSLEKAEADRLHSWPNVWPGFMNLKDPSETYFSHMEVYSLLIQEVLSLALGEEKDFLQNLCKDGDTSSRMIHYPYVKGDEISSDQVLWCAEHTDIGLFTILPKPTSEGLELLKKDGSWMNVYGGEDTFVVNAGDLLEIISNGYFKSTIHRVLKPKSMTKDRFSVTFFVHPRSEALLSPLEKWVKQAGGKKKYVEATRYEMLMERLADNGLASKKMLKELADSKILERLLTVDRASVEAMEAVYEAGFASNEIKEKLSSMK